MAHHGSNGQRTAHNQDHYEINQPKIYNLQWQPNNGTANHQSVFTTTSSISRNYIKYILILEINIQVRGYRQLNQSQKLK